MVHNYCIYPFKTHKKEISKNLRPAVENKVQSKDPNKCLSTLPVKEALKNDYELKTTLSSSGASSTFVEGEKLSGVTPVKKAHLVIKQRKNGEEKLQAALITVKKQLEDSYDVTLSIQEEDLSLDQQSKFKKFCVIN
ncbi:hypothetical protein Avbf_02043 [Armadillidium vulgare]|nr:hypothetical protein Avbf_02043 [Armadillidium vulgare]